MGPFTADTTTTHANLLNTWFDKVLLETFDKTQKFYQFAEKTAIPTGFGNTATWHRANRLALGYLLTEGTPPSNQALGTTRVSTIISQYGAVVGFTDFADLTSIVDLGEMAAKRIAAQSADTVDTIIQQAIILQANTTNNSVVHYTKHSAGAYFTISPSAAQNVLSTTYIGVSDIREVAHYLKGLDVPGFMGTDYMAITTPQVINKLEADTNWVSYHQYADKGVENLYNGDIGRLYGTRFFMSNLVRVSAGSCDGAASVQWAAASVQTGGLAHATFMFGQGWFGAVDLGGNIQTTTLRGADKSDPLNQIVKYGWKVNMGAQVLNGSAGVVMWSGVNQTFAACLASAREAAGLRIYGPATSL